MQNILAILLVLVGFDFSLQVEASGYRVTGVITQTNFPDGKEETWEFEAATLGDCYLITSHPNATQTHVVGCDGTNTFTLLAESPSPGGKIKKPVKLGYVFDGVYPGMGGSLRGRLPWLAYCSGTLITSEGTNGAVHLPAPWNAASFAMPMAHIFISHYKSLPGSGGLPAYLDYSVDPERIEDMKNGNYHTLVDMDKQAQAHVASELKYKSRITEPVGIYEVTRTTNAGGISIPAKFSFNIYTFFPGDSKGAPRKRLSSALGGELTSVEMIDQLDPLPKTASGPADIEVCDYRFYTHGNGVPFVRYIAANSAWIQDKHDPRLQKRFLADQRSRNGRITAGQRTVILVCLTFALLTLATLASRRVRNHFLGWLKPNREGIRP